MPEILEQLTADELEKRERELLASVPSEPNIPLAPSGLEIRERELIESLRKNGIDTNEPEIILPLEESFYRDQNTQKILNLPSMAGADPSDVILNPEIYEPKIGFGEALVRARKLELLPFVGSLFKAERILSVLKAAKRLSLPDGTMTDDLTRPRYIGFESITGPIEYSQIPVDDLRESDIKLVEDWIIRLNEEQERGFSIGGRIAQGIAELPAFMIEFLLTGPIFKIGSASAKTAATKVLGRFAEKGVGKLAVRVAGAGFGSFVRTAVNVPRILAGTVENMTKGIQITDDGAVAFSDAEANPFGALARSFTDLYIENLTEIAGPSLKKGVLAVGTGIGKKFPVLQKFTQAVADKWIANKAGRTISGFLKLSATKVGYDGILEEMGEEQLGRMLRSAIGLQTFGEMIPSMEDMLVEAGIFTVIPVGISLSKAKIFRTDIRLEPIEKRLGLVGKELEVPPTEVVTAPEIAKPKAVEVAKAEEARVVKTTIETKTNAIKANTKEASVEAVGTVDAIRRNVLRAEDAVGFWGTAGKKVQRDLREISARTSKNVGNTSQNIGSILKGLTSKERTNVSQLTDKAISKEGQPQRLIERARLLTVELDLMQIEAQDVGLRKGELTGKAFPQIPNKKGKAFLEEAETKGAKSHRVFAWVQNKVTEGKYKNVDAAIAALQNYRKTRLRGTEGYFEGKRIVELDLDMREWNPSDVLPGIIEGGWESIEGARQWGVTKDGNFKDIRTSIERIRNEVGRDQANLLEDYIKAQYGQSRASITAKKWTKTARSVQFVGKLALSPLTITRNMLDRYAKGLTQGTIGTNIRATLKFPPFLNKWLKTSQKIQDEMIRQGAVLGHGHLSEGFASGGKVSRFIGQPFAQSERGNQTYIAVVKKIQLEADIKRLHEMGGESGTVGKMYDKMLSVVGKSQLQTRSRLLTNLTNEQLVDALDKKEIDNDVMSEVLHRVATDSAFPLTLASKRMWWGNRPFVQTMTQFKVWSADQMRFIYKDVLKYTIATGDPSRLARFILGTWLAGELYNIARDFLTDKDESLLSTLQDEDGRNVKEIAKSVGNALVDGGVIGMLADLTYGITDWAFGPTVGSIESIAARGFAVAIDPATTIDGLKMFVLDDVPTAKQAQGVLDRIDRTFFNKEENLTADYAKWRRRSFDFRKKKGELTEIERLTGRILFSRTKRLPGPRTLSFEMIARQVLVGDADDAADYIVGIIKDTKPEKLKDLRASFRQSAVNNSPLGNISKEDIPEFLKQFSTKGQVEIIALQRQWQKNYNEAITLASRQLKEDKFFEELQRELKEARK